MFCDRDAEREWPRHGTPSKPVMNTVQRGNVAALLMVEPTNRRAIVDRDGIESRDNKKLYLFVDAVSYLKT